MLAFPVRHISIRVPWHDAGWDGSVCLAPRHNSACLKLDTIAERKNEEVEATLIGSRFEDLDPAQVPPCMKERGAFMSPRPIFAQYNHPYQQFNDAFRHFKPTPIQHPPYSAAGLPFRWMMRGEREILARQHPLEALDDSLEPNLGFPTDWWQDHRNHTALLDTFWEYVRREESLVFFYAKQTPLLEGEPSRRILVGVGRVKAVGPLNEYQYDGPPDGKQQALIWERMIGHSIRPTMTDGFLLPYHEALEKCVDGKFNPAEVVALTPEGRFTEFSYATEHVGDDAAIEALQSIRSALLKSAELFGADIQKQEEWIDRELGRLWTKRGPFPGIGAVLSATGLGMGNFIAREVSEQAGDDASPWDAWFSVLNDPAANLPPELAYHVDGTVAATWQRMPTDRRTYLELLSRIDLSFDQARLLATPEERGPVGVPADDAAIIANPYLLYESTRLTANPVPIGLVDRGVFQSHSKLGKFPVPEPTRIATLVDKRRLRALVIRNLEDAAVTGHTLLPREDIVVNLRRGDEADGDPELLVTADHLKVAEDDVFAGEVRVVEMSDGKPAYQLERLRQAGSLIRRTVEQRMSGKRYNVKADWRAELDRELGSSGEDEEENKAREEKARALDEIANARFSVLTGSAGTGKTTMLSVLCKQPEIQQGGVALLAPTGKARVRMEDIARRAGIQNFKAYTLAQFLRRSERYDYKTQRYMLTGRPGEPIEKNVIVDECSMLTEEMLAALIESLKGMGVERLILVGDHRQLPPIGAGRPFADIVARIRPEDAIFPRVTDSYAELTIPRRQAPDDRDALDLAEWFGGEPTPGHDRILEVLSDKRASETVKVVRWDTIDELNGKLPDVLAEHLNFAPDVDESLEFARSLGGVVDRSYAYFNHGRSGAEAERWQILTPSRSKPEGVESLNRLIHRVYKGQLVAAATHPRGQRHFLKPQGDQLIVYGDKVINTINRALRASEVWPTRSDAYLANGEIGIVVGQIRTRNFNYDPRNLEVEFSTQQGQKVKFFPTAFSQERDSGLELAYALTIHKAQGSEFETVFLVLPSNIGYLLSRELIYTALTRQTKRVVLLVQGSPTDMLAISSEQHSDTASRLTNIFAPPTKVQIEGKFFEDRLIHKTERGEAVRSKSEVIIANILYAKGINYLYEKPLEIDGVVKYPDFTIDDDNTGETYYLEHLGMLSLPTYKQAWEEKLRWYEEHGILPRERGGGERGTLIVTEDSAEGGIDSAAVSQMIGELFGA